MKAWARALLVVVSIGFAVAPANVESCGPFIPEAIFTAPAPFEPRKSFAHGQLGVIQVGFDPAALAIAYRYLTGLDLNQAEVDEIYPRPVPSTNDPYANYGPSPGVTRWLAARSLVTNLPDHLDSYKQIDPFQSVHNCLDDAFETATQTLQDRTKRWGAPSPALTNWIEGQDAVFSNCSAGGAAPEGVPPGSPVLLEKDRAYQLAATAFYAGEWQSALERFREIADDSQSPWHEIAPYLAARVLIRKGTLDGDLESLRAAQAALNAINSDRARRLLGFVEAHLGPERRYAQLSEVLLQKRLGSDAGQEVSDFAKLYPKDSSPQDKRSNNALIEWVDFWSAHSPERGQYSLERWRKGGGLPWLIAALESARPDDAGAPELLQAATQVARSSPGYVSVAYYSAALLMKRNERAGARSWDDRVLLQPLTDPDRNLIRAQRFRLARNWTEFLRYAPRVVAMTGDMDDRPYPIEPGKRIPAFDNDSTDIWNEAVPIPLWIDGASSPMLPKSLRTRLAMAGWVRAVVLDRQEEAGKLLARWTELDPDQAKLAEGFRQASDPDRARFAAALAMLRNPGLQPFIRSGFARETRVDRMDSFRDNWWCYATYEELQASKTGETVHVGAKVHPGPNAFFLEPAARLQGATEWQRLKTIATLGSNYLPSESIRWARLHPDDPLVPEALARAVRTTHYSCTDSKTGAYSKQAFLLLKSRYPGTKWAQQTKYWYK